MSGVTWNAMEDVANSPAAQKSVTVGVPTAQQVFHNLWAQCMTEEFVVTFFYTHMDSHTYDSVKQISSPLPSV